MTITISASGIALDGPLVAGEKVAVSVSGIALVAEDKPTLALLARFPDALLASVELAEDADAPGTWTGELDTATKQTALFFATARADERRDAALELVAGRASLARLTVPMANSALCPKPDGSPFASPVYVPVPGPPGTGGDPYDQAPEMDGEASAGAADEYARGDHRHPTDTTRQEVIEDLAAIRSGAAAGATAVQPSALATVATTGDYGDLLNKPTIPAAQIQSDWNQTNAAAVDYIKNKPTIPSASGFVQKTGDQQMQGDLTVSRAGGTPPADYVTIGNATGSDANSFVVVNNGGKQLAMVAAANQDPALITMTGNLFGVAKTPANNGTLALQEGIAPAFSTSSTYAVGDYCTYQGLLYKCTTAVSTAGAWNAANWTAVSAMAEMPAPITVDSAMSSSSTNPVQNKVVEAAIKERVPWANSSKNAVSIGPRTGNVGSGSLVVGSSDNTASNSGSIAVGANNTASGINGAAFGQQTTASSNNAFACGYRARATHEKSFVWNGGTGYYDSSAKGQFRINPNDGTSGFYVGGDSLASLLRYSFASQTPSVSGTSATVACEDRAINDFTIETGITSLAITPPAAVTGRARDFFCRVTLTDSSLPTVTLSGATIDIGSTEVAGMTQGVNLLMFTEIASGHWLASRRSAS